MKKTFLILVIFIVVAFALVYGYLKRQENMHKQIYIQNLEYEAYLDKTVYGTEVATVIDKATNQNEKNRIKKDEKGYYIENDEDSIKIYIKMIITGKTYPMEEMYKNNISQFVQYYNLVEFKCTRIEYHEKTGRISRLFFEEQEI